MPGLLNAEYQITDLGGGSDKQGFVLVLLVSLAAKLNKSSRWWACRSLSARGHSKGRCAQRENEYSRDRRCSLIRAAAVSNAGAGHGNEEGAEQ